MEATRVLTAPGKYGLEFLVACGSRGCGGGLPTTLYPAAFGQFRCLEAAGSKLRISSASNSHGICSCLVKLRLWVTGQPLSLVSMNNGYKMLQSIHYAVYMSRKLASAN